MLCVCCVYMCSCYMLVAICLVARCCYVMLSLSVIHCMNILNDMIFPRRAPGLFVMLCSVCVYIYIYIV